MNYPSEIEKTVLELAEYNRQSAELRERLAATEAIIIQDIAAAKTPEGKPQFSNESVRAAELTLRIRVDAEAAGIKAQIERGEMQVMILLSGKSINHEIPAVLLLTKYDR